MDTFMRLLSIANRFVLMNANNISLSIVCQILTSDMICLHFGLSLIFFKVYCHVF